MRLLRVREVEKVGPVSVLWGVVENARIIVGQDVAVVSSNGERDGAVITGIVPGAPEVKAFDEATPGDVVKVMFRRADPSFPDDEITALEDMPLA